MFSFFLLVAALAGLAHCQDTCTLYKYYTSNTFLPRSIFTYTCYGIGSDCEVYYSPPGAGCIESSLKLIATIAENETKTVASYINVELGGGFCSNNEIVVSFFELNPRAKADLPRATEAGTNFHIAMMGNDTYAANYQCRIATLSLPAQIEIFMDGLGTIITIDRFNIHELSIDQRISLQTKIRIKSSNPIIVSCNARSRVTPFFALQPISSERLLVTTAGHTIVTVLLSDCSTNEIITDFSTVNVESSQLSGDSCDPVQVKEDFGTRAYFFTAECIVLIDATNDVCVSVMKQVDNHFLADMGLPESKFSTRFVHYDLDDTFFQFSYIVTSCTGYRTSDSSDSTVPFDKDWLNGDLNGKVANTLSESALSEFTSSNCFAPTFLVVNDVSTGLPFILGSQSEDLWEPFFDSECSETPTEAPVEPPGEPPDEPPAEEPPAEEPPAEEPPAEEPPAEEPPGQPPGETPVETPTQIPVNPTSDAHSIISCINWFAFFGVIFFSSILV